ncbi:MAG: EthD family reductase [Acetobacteraceae bacterium]|nr:EthD family reductase [Acetobacteraceae bacterium]MBV8578945.1 EthD family reductase [Acetobacteraceae bacterium]
MFVISVIYPQSSRFDLTYYVEKHIPLVRSRWNSLGLKNISVLKGTGGVGGGAATYPIMALLNFDRLEDFHAAVQQHGKEVMGDIPNFTDAQPVLQINESVV